MIISKSRIIHPERYLTEVEDGVTFRLCTKILDDQWEILESYGLFERGNPRIPAPRKAATIFNADGKSVADKTLPKEIRCFERWYRVIDWHGNSHSGICWVHKDCYQRSFIPPTEVSFCIHDGMLYSEVLENTEDHMPVIRAAMNAMLEMVGRFEVCNADMTPLLPAMDEAFVPWEILRSGTRDDILWQEYIERTISNKPDVQKHLIRNHHAVLGGLYPIRRILGMNNFLGYVVYEFADGLFIFESNQPNNATYVFQGEWEQASRLTKTEILRTHRHVCRIFHNETWETRLRNLVLNNQKEGVA